MNWNKSSKNFKHFGDFNEFWQLLGKRSVIYDTFGPKNRGQSSGTTFKYIKKIILILNLSHLDSFFKIDKKIIKKSSESRLISTLFSN